MEDTLNAMLLSTLPDTPKKPRASNRTAKRIVKNSVKGKTTKISAEQGFRNYLKYTDPLLQESDETTDRSKYADDIEKIINLVNSAGGAESLNPAEGISKSAQKVLRNEPIERGDILSEIQPIKLATSTPAKPSKKPLIEIYKSPAQRKNKEEEIKNKSATAIQSAVRNSKAKKELNNLKEEKQNKSANVIQSAIRNSQAKKELNNLKLQEEQNKSANIIQSAVRNSKAKKEMLGALKEKKTTLNKLNKTLDANFYKHGKDKQKPDKIKK